MKKHLTLLLKKITRLKPGEKDMFYVCLTLVIVTINTILATRVWPLYAAMPLLLPAELTFFTIAFTLLVARGNLPSRIYPYLLYALALNTLWAFSLPGADLVGSDLHVEHYIAQQSLWAGWNINYESQSAVSPVVGLLVPALSRLTGLSVLWVIKALLPAFLALTIPLLYLAYRRQFKTANPQYAFYAALFFLVMPVFTLEVNTIVKSMVAEVFLAGVILAVASGLKQWQKALAITFGTIAALLAHYTIGFIIIFYLVCFLAAKPLIWIASKTHELYWLRKLKKDTRGQINPTYRLWVKFAALFKNSHLAYWVILVALAVNLGAGYWYYGIYGEKQRMLDTVKTVANNYGGMVLNKLGLAKIEPITKAKANISDSVTIDVDAQWVIDSYQGIMSEKYDPSKSYLEYQPPLVKAGLGLDFGESSPAGKVFRVVQYLTQLFIIAGALIILMRPRRYRFSTEFIVGIGASFMLLLACIFVPNFSAIMNMTRFYHYSLLFLAPCFAVGADLLTLGRTPGPARTRATRWLTPALLCVYLIFTGGMVYEATRSTETQRFDLPYSAICGGNRTGLIAIFNEDDIAAAKWLAYNSNQDNRISTDFNGFLLLESYMTTVPRMRDVVVERGWVLDTVPPNTYILLHTWNMATGLYIEPQGAGLRCQLPLPNFSRYPVVYHQGRAIVYLKEN